jgi:hypothetical protein
MTLPRFDDDLREGHDVGGDDRGGRDEGWTSLALGADVQEGEPP